MSEAVLLPDSMKSLSQLQVLNLSQNPLQQVPTGIRYLTCLRELYMNECWIQAIPEGVFDRLGQLDVLSLEWNSLVVIDRNMLPKSLGALKRLSLRYNKISSINKEVMEHLLKVEKVDVMHNPVFCEFEKRR